MLKNYQYPSLEEFPKHRFAWKVLGAVLKQKGRISESLIVVSKICAVRSTGCQSPQQLGDRILQELEKIRGS